MRLTLGGRQACRAKKTLGSRTEEQRSGSCLATNPSDQHQRRLLTAAATASPRTTSPRPKPTKPRRRGDRSPGRSRRLSPRPQRPARTRRTTLPVRRNQAPNGRVMTRLSDVSGLAQSSAPLGRKVAELGAPSGRPASRLAAATWDGEGPRTRRSVDASPAAGGLQRPPSRCSTLPNANAQAARSARVTATRRNRPPGEVYQASLYM